LKKLSFTINDAKLVNDNPNSNFALLSLDFFASGKNKHDTYVSEDTLLKYADTIKNCPVVWKYDPILDDVGTHDPEETPCGFIPQDADISNRKLEDGRTMLTTLSYIWKRYSGNLLEFFKRDGDKPVSVEMSLFESEERPDNLLELKDYKFDAVTVLGSLVTPAIPMAKATVLQYSDEYKDAYKKEFASKYSSIDFSIPPEIKSNAKVALEKYNERGGSATSVSLAMAKFLIRNEEISTEKVSQIVRFFNKNPQYDEITFGFFGGIAGANWAKALYEEIQKADSVYFNKGVLVTMPYKSLADANPALKGIDPPISLAQANAIAKQADAVGTTDKVNGWAVAISSFHKTHHVENGKWVENKKEESMAEEEFAKGDLGKGELIRVDKSKDKVSNTAWGNVDKTALMHKVLGASNYKSLVNDVYLVVESGWEDHPSQSLKYPVMQLVNGVFVYNSGALSAAMGRANGQGESAVASKAEGIQKKLGLQQKEEAKMAEEEKKPEEEMAEEKKETPAEEKAETPAEEKKEKEEGKEEEMAEKDDGGDGKDDEDEKDGEDGEDEKDEKMSKFDFPKNFDFEKMGKLFADDEDQDVKMAKDELIKNGKFCNPTAVMGGMYAKMCKMAEAVEKMAEANKAYMAENEELKKFKASVEEQQKMAEVDKTLKEMAEKVNIPDEEMAAFRASAEKYSFAQLDAWKNECKAKSFDFTAKKNSKDSVEKIGLPWNNNNLPKPNRDIWAGIK
jgi:hypothetical protein